VLLEIRDRKAQLVLLDFRELPDLKAQLDLRVFKVFKVFREQSGILALRGLRV
jgi:hypothetical protein